MILVPQAVVLCLATICCYTNCVYITVEQSDNVLLVQNLTQPVDAGGFETLPQTSRLLVYLPFPDQKSEISVHLAHMTSSIALHRTSNDCALCDAVGIRVLSDHATYDQPVVKFFVHQKQRDNEPSGKDEVLCVTVFAGFGLEKVSGACSPSLDEHNICVINLILPISLESNYKQAHPSLIENTTRTGQAMPARLVELSYTVKLTNYCRQSSQAAFSGEQNRQPISDEQTRYLGAIPLLLSPVGYRSLPIDNRITVFIPEPPVVVVGTVLSLPVWYNAESEGSAVMPNFFQLKTNDEGSLLFNVVIEVHPNSERILQGRFGLQWYVRYDLEVGDIAATTATPLSRKRGVSFEMPFEKDTEMTLVPLTEKTEIINSAILTGKRVSVPLRIFSIGVAGKVRDVTKQTTCISSASHIVKVSTQCTHVYVDGSEIQGSSNVSVTAYHKQLDISGKSTFAVWQPDVPATIWLSDSVLNRIKGWAAPAYEEKLKKIKFQDLKCKPVWQFSQVKVFVRYKIDEPGGRRLYLGGLGHRALFEVTQEVRERLRLSDPRIAELEFLNEKVFIRARNYGSNQIELFSPWNIRFGHAQFTISPNLVHIQSFRVSAIAGVNAVAKSESRTGLFLLETAPKFTFDSSHQHGVVSIQFEYTDGLAANLEDFDSTSFALAVLPSNDDIIEIERSHSLLPEFRVNVSRSGSTDENFLDIVLHSSTEYCNLDGSAATLEGKAYVIIQSFAQSPDEVPVATKESFNESRANSSSYPVNVILRDHLLRDDVHVKTNGLYFASTANNDSGFLSAQLSKGEIVLYALLGVFTVAAVVLAVHFLVDRRRAYKLLTGLSTFKPASSDFEDSSKAVAQEWVWLGSEVLEQSSIQTQCSQHLLPDDEFKELIAVADGFEGAAMTYPLRHSPKANRVSYQGSEISVHISPRPCLEIHQGRARQIKTATWANDNWPKRIRTNYLDNSSLPTTMLCSAPSINLSPQSDVSWDRRSMGMSEAQFRYYFDNLRETSA